MSEAEKIRRKQSLLKLGLGLCLTKVVSNLLAGARYMLELIRSCRLVFWELELLYSTKREKTIKLISWKARPSTYTSLETRSLEAFQHGKLYHRVLLPNLKIV